MDIIPAEEFNRQARHAKKSSGRIYHNRTYSPGVIFATKRKLVAIKYCQELMNKNSSLLCILVEDTYHIQVWYEQSSRHLLYRIPQRITQTAKKQEANLPSQASPLPLLASKNLPIDRAFVIQCQRILTEFIGPIAKIIVKRTVSQNAKSNRQQFINLLTKELQKNSKIPGLEQRLQELLDDS